MAYAIENKGRRNYQKVAKCIDLCHKENLKHGLKFLYLKAGKLEIFYIIGQILFPVLSELENINLKL